MLFFIPKEILRYLFGVNPNRVNPDALVKPEIGADQVEASKWQIKFMIKIYTDGAAKGNPGNGGYGVVLLYKNMRKEMSEGFRLTTNNRMELLAVITGLEALKVDSLPVTIFSDSKYVIDAVQKGWIWSWQKKGFKDKKNVDLWKRYIPLHLKYKPKFQWVKGHDGNIENERCDDLAVTAAASPVLKIDGGYEAVQKNGLF